MPTVIKIKKRNGEIVDFSKPKIVSAVNKAFIAVRNGIDPVILERVAENVCQKVEHLFPESTPGVENVQDLVERELMAEGFFDVAKSYIIYRYEHTKIREEKKQEVIEKIEEGELYVTKRDGRRERFSLDKLKKSLARAARGFEDVVNIEAVALQCRGELYENITTKDVSKALIMTARALIEQDPAYSTIASRLLLNDNYEEVIGTDVVDWSRIEEQHREAFIRNLKEGVEIKRIDPRLLEFDLEKISKAMDITRDDLFVYLGTQTLYDRYFVRNSETGRVLETPQMFWMRIAMGTAILEDKMMRDNVAIQFYEIMSDFSYTPSTPTLFHSGTPKPQLSSCYLNTVSDDLHDIFKTYSDNAQLSKWSGGIGTDWSSLRGTGAFIKGTGVESQGVIPFLKIANDVTVAINRSGRRRGASCVYLETWHYDIEDFLELRKNTGDERRRTHDMNTANWIPDLFMERVRDDKEWTLFSPDETPELHETYGKTFKLHYERYEEMVRAGKIKLYKTLKARDLWKKMLSMLYETGHPWVTFKDPSNIRSPQDHVGVVHNSNLCTEITLNTSQGETAVCNLGSLNFAKFVRNGKFDEEYVGRVTRIAMRMLDNVIDINYYPTEDAKRSNFRHRPVGLGIRGYQDALYMLGINFDSEANVEFADSSMEVVAYNAYLASSDLARERGAYQTFKGSKWDRGILPLDTIALLEAERDAVIPVPKSSRLDWTPVRNSIRQYGMRNSNCLAIAPTATTANIVGCIPTIEPIYKNLYVKSNQAGDFIVINPYLVSELKTIGLWDFEMLGKIKYNDGSVSRISEIPEHVRAKYKEVFEIDQKWLVKSAAYRSKWIDQSQSLNIYFSGTSGKDISDIYMYAWEMGLKTTYYLRTLAISQVEKSTVSTAEYGSTHKRGASEQTVGPVSAEVRPEPAPVVSPIQVAQPSPIQMPTPVPVRAQSEPVAAKKDTPEISLTLPKNVYIAADAVCESCSS